MPHSLTAARSGALSGTARVPGDKSISHRALILGALSTGRTRIEGLLKAEDVLATARAIEALGACLRRENSAIEVWGQGVGGLRAPRGALDFGNSGTGSRLMLGVVAGHDMAAEFTGDASLMRRPMGRVLAPLEKMGLRRKEGSGDTFPLTVKGTSDLVPIRYEMPMASAQVKSAVLLAGLHAPGRTTIVEPAAARDHTERMLAHFGAEIAIEELGGGRAVTVRGDAELAGRPVTVPGDPSSAAFVIAAALITPGSELVIENMLMNPTRIGFLETAREMGASIELLDLRDEGGEPVADLKVKASEFQGVTVPPERAPSMIDEYPVLAVLAAFAAGETRMRGLSELRVKESDRLAATAAGLATLGVEAAIEGDDLIVSGEGAGGVPGGGLVRTEMDHRIAMAFLIAGLGSTAPVSIDDTTMIATSFPNFVQLMAGLGADFR